MHWRITVLEIEGFGVELLKQVGVVLTIVTDKLRGDDNDLEDYAR